MCAGYLGLVGTVTDPFLDNPTQMVIVERKIKTQAA